VLGDYEHRVGGSVIGTPSDPVKRATVYAARRGIDGKVNMPLPDVILVAFGSIMDGIEVAL
jgi:hypothetical protein